MIPIIWGAAGNCVPLEEIRRPNADGSTSGTWTASGGGSLYTMLDESSASDADYVYNADFGAICPTQTTVFFEIGLEDPSDTPGSEFCNTITVRHRARKTEALNTTDLDLTVALMEGGSTRASATYNNIGTTFTTRSFTLTETEYGNILNHNNLEIRFTFSGCGNADPYILQAQVSWAEIEYVAT